MQEKKKEELGSGRKKEKKMRKCEGIYKLFINNAQLVNGTWIIVECLCMLEMNGNEE
jgi:hypothetical protein